jgi:hypothetical protein
MVLITNKGSTGSASKVQDPTRQDILRDLGRADSL